jgi:hypothetical protein
MFETAMQRSEREKSESASRRENIRRYERKMGIELPYSPVAVVERKPEKPVESSGAASGNGTREKLRKNVGGSRAAYMAAFRKRPVVCPACGHTFTKLKRLK